MDEAAAVVAGLEAPGPVVLSRSRIAAVVVGNGLEFYDFITFSFFAPQIGRSFFPGASEADRVLLALATFGAGFLTRPLGGVVIGRLADRVGRKPAMQLSFLLMGVAITALALTPPASTIGPAAPLLVVAFRLLQGFALGGEVGPTTAYVAEAAPPGRRGFYCSLLSATGDAAVLAAGLVGTGLAAVLTPGQLTGFGWRIALLLGAAVVPFGFVLRRRLAETLPVQAAQAAPPEEARRYLPVAMTGLALLGGATFVNYTLDYLTTYAQTTLRMTPKVALAATVVVGAASMAGDLLSGRLSDRFGRKPVMIAPWAALLLLTLPVFTLIVRERSPMALLGGAAVLAFTSCVGSTAILPWLAEALPARVRAGAFGITYALAISVFGGSCQFVLAAITRTTGNALAPSWAMSLAIAVGLVAMTLLRETAPRRPRAA